MDKIKDTVECYSGGVYAERPTAVWWQEERLEVEAIEASWLTPTGRAFRVRTRDGRNFKVLYTEAQDEWSVRPG